MKKADLQIVVPLLLSFIVIFFLFKNEYSLNENDISLFDLLKNRNSTDVSKPSTSTENSKFLELAEKINNEEGTFSLHIKDMSDNKTYEFNSNEQYYPLSLFKIPIAYIVARDVENGKLKWEDPIEYLHEDYFDIFGTISSSGFGSEYSLQKVVELMLRESDNTAPKMIKRVLGEEYLNNEFKKITGDKNADLFDEYLLTDVKKCLLQWENIFYKKWLSDENTELLLSFLNPTSYDQALIPYLDDDVTFYHKVGISVDMYHNCGILKKENKDIIICIMSKNATEESFDSVNNYIAEFVNNL